MNNLIILSAQTVPEGRVFGLDSQTLIQIGFQLFNGILLAVLLTFILYKPVKDFLDKRTERIRTNRQEAEDMMAEATVLIAEYEAKLKDVEAEKIQILETARAEASKQSKEMLDEAALEADKLKQQAIDKVNADKKRLHEESRLHIIELSSVIAEKYLAENLDEKAQKDYFDAMITQLEESAWTS